MTVVVSDRCASCGHFEANAQGIEAALPGLAVLSSAHASVRDADGYCALHGRYLRNTAHCGQFVDSLRAWPPGAPMTRVLG